jgi:hypothetical protein
VNPATFFAKASFADFLAGLGALLQGHRAQLPVDRVLAFVPPDGDDRFFRSEFFARVLISAFLQPGHPSASALAAFVLERATPANIRSITALLWRDSVFRRANLVPEAHCLSSAILRKFPSSVEGFHSAGHFEYLYGRLTDVTLPLTHSYIIAQTLASFNESFLLYSSASSRGFFKPKLRSLMDVYRQIAFRPLFALMLGTSPDPPFEDALPRLIASYAALAPKYASAALTALEGSPVIRAVPGSVKKFVSEMTGKICRAGVAARPEARAEARQILVRELDAALQVAPPDFAVLNPVCTALTEIGIDGELGIAEHMTELCLQAEDLTVFHGGVIDLLEAIGTPDLALMWIEHFWGLFVPVLGAPREKGDAAATQRLFEAVRNTVPLITRFEKKFSIQLGSLDASRDLLTVCALELTSAKIPGSEEVIQVLVDWSTKFVVCT